MATWGGQKNLKAGLLALAQQYADAGMFARAKAAFQKAGGVWTKEVHRLMKREAEATSRYGGDINFNWLAYGVKTQDQLNHIVSLAKEGKFGKISSYIKTLGGKEWDKNLHKKVAAEYLGKQDKTKTGKEFEFKRDVPTVAPQLFKEGAPWKERKEQFKGPITEANIGAWKTPGSQARADAKEWRNLHMDAAKKKWGFGTEDFDKDKYVEQRNKIASRHRKMLGAGPKTLKSGVTLEY
jgi:hypothetical protein